MEFVKIFKECLSYFSLFLSFFFFLTLSFLFPAPYRSSDSDEFLKSSLFSINQKEDFADRKRQKNNE